METVEQLEKHAIDAAVNTDWDEAVLTNKKIIQLDKHNLSAILRLGFAYLQKQDLDEAKKYYRKAIKIQSNNNVALENLERINVLQTKKTRKSSRSQISLDPNLFLDIPGKTKSVALVNLGQKNVLAQLFIGQEAFLKAKNRKVEARTKENEYIGTLPDDLSRRLLVFLKAKSIYAAFIKEASLARITIFIREERKGNRVQHYISFPHNIQSRINELKSEKEGDEESTETVEIDLEKLAESMAAEEKEYLPYGPGEEEENEEE